MRNKYYSNKAQKRASMKLEVAISGPLFLVAGDQDRALLRVPKTSPYSSFTSQCVF